MKLEFAENLKKMRRERDMTQEELAEKLSLSVQAISRYETGTTYPDIEMLPVIAGFFGVTVDALLGTSPEVREKRKDEYIERLRMITDRKERLTLLRQQHAEFPECWGVVSDMLYEMTFLPECLEEARMLAEDGVHHCTEILWRENIIMHYLHAESDENRALTFIYKWASKYDMKTASLLRLYYNLHGNTEKEQPLNQKILSERLTESLWALAKDIDSCEEIICFLDRITKKTDHTEPDLWLNLKWKLYLKLADCAFSDGNDEKGYTVLEELVSLIEKVFSLPDGTVLSHHIGALNLLDAKTKKEVFYQITENRGIVAHSVMLNMCYLSRVAPVDIAADTIRDMEAFEGEVFFAKLVEDCINSPGMRGFRRVKDEKRFQKLRERVFAVSSIENTDNLLFELQRKAKLRGDQRGEFGDWSASLLVHGVGAYPIYDNADAIHSILERMKREGNTRVAVVVASKNGGGLIPMPKILLKELLSLNAENAEADVIITDADESIFTVKMKSYL